MIGARVWSGLFRWLLPVGFAAGVVVGAVLLAGWLASASGREELATRLPWYVSRSAGITAYALLSASTLLGLAISTRVMDRRAARPALFALHEHCSWLALAAVALHAGVLLIDTYLPFTPLGVLVPFMAPYRPLSVALGVTAMYLAIVLTVSFYIKPWLGHRAWRAIHYGSFAVYGLVTLHGILAGNSTGEAWMQWLYVAGGAPIFALLCYRLLLLLTPPATAPVPPVPEPRPVAPFGGEPSAEAWIMWAPPERRRTAGTGPAGRVAREGVRTDPQPDDLATTPR